MFAVAVSFLFVLVVMVSDIVCGVYVFVYRNLIPFFHCKQQHRKVCVNGKETQDESTSCVCVCVCARAWGGERGKAKWNRIMERKMFAKCPWKYIIHTQPYTLHTPAPYTIQTIYNELSTPFAIKNLTLSDCRYVRMCTIDVYHIQTMLKKRTYINWKHVWALRSLCA